MLAAQAAPTTVALFAAAGHAAFHLSERMAQVQAEHMAHERAHLVDGAVVLEHSHGPGEDVHTHVLPVDIALKLAEPSERDHHGPTVPVDQRVDQHVPPEAGEDRPGPSAMPSGTMVPSGARSVPPSPPPLPPPRA